MEKIDNVQTQVKDRFPRIVFFIILTEFCERFSFSGMKAFLTLYLRSKLGYTDEGATETYHVFTTFVYVFPIIGGILADNWLGKFRTILYLMFIYAAGNILVAVTAIPVLNLPANTYTLLGLFMITLGTGGIKPCTTAFGGEQLQSPEHQKYLAIYFSILYFVLCVGSVIAKIVSPILRSEVQCFGDKDCYSLAFGAPGLVVLLSMVIFVSAQSRYVINKPNGTVLFDFVKCIFAGLKATLIKGKMNKNDHWLDSVQHKYDKSFIRDVKKTLSLLKLFTVIPMFWALLDQMGSRWTLQATKMNGSLGFITVKPDQLQVIAPVCILILIPLSQKYVYPYLEKRNILKNPLHRLTVGGILAGFAFIASAFVEIYIKTTYPELPQAGYSQIRIFNGNPCSVSIYNDEQNIIYTIPSLSLYTNKHIPARETENLTLTLGGNCIEPRNETFWLEENNAVSFYLTGDKVTRLMDNVDKSKSGLPVVRFFVSKQVNASTISLFNERRNEVECLIHSGISKRTEVFASEYSLRVNSVSKDLSMLSGGVYAIMVGDHYETSINIITEPNSITMAWLLPQFIIISVAEVLFAITGNAFSFKESPDSMKAVMTAFFLLTEAFGNVIIIVITRVFVNYTQETQSFIYSGLMFASIAVLYYMSRSYKIKEEKTEKSRSNSEVLYQRVKQVEDVL
ncbi:peptide transporter family 1-like isoform X1 [Colias croceus]|uniref:peptide transporter family 1-like isoform X1 n=2 Tax=Colias crocea TaxID=72248 RepID=UPI001E27EB52|nr:peptide transporter family 1-like isoform X1 [Colias croceus]